jgi:hypothetical protein
MDINKVNEYLKTDSNISKQTLLKNIEHELDIGNLVVDLLCKAENGDFFEMKKPEMVRLCLTKYSYYSNNYDNCTTEEIVGCNNCVWYVPKNVLRLFEKFEKEGFPTDEELGILLGY